MVKKKKKSIFRREVIEAQIARHGEVVLIRPISFTVVTGFILAIILFAIIYLAVANFTKSTSVKGVLKTPQGVSKVMAYQSGVISEVMVAEGSLVTKGQPLYRIRTEKQSDDGSITAKKIASIDHSVALLKDKIQFQKDLNQLELTQSEQKVEILLAEALQVDDEIALQKDYLRLLSSELSEVEKLLKAKQISKSEYNAKYAQVLEKRISLKNLSRKKRDYLNQSKDVKKQRRNIELKGNTMVVSYQEQLAVLERQLDDIKAQKSYVIKAPVDGVIANIFYQQGHFAQMNKPLMNILPKDAHLVAEIYIPTSAIGLVKAGQSILLRYHAFPFQKFGLHHGQIESISKTLIEPFQAEVDSLIDEPAYRATVVLKRQNIDAQGKLVDLQPGMVLDADVVGDTRSLLAWIFEPLTTAGMN